MLLREKLLVSMCLLLVIVGVADLNTSYINDLWEKTLGFPGRFMIMQGPKVGYVNARSRLVIPPTLDEGVGYFDRDLAPASKAGQWGFIDINGHWVIPPKFQSAKSFQDNLAAVSSLSSGVRKFGFIGRDGQWKIPPAYAEAGNFSDGVAPVKTAGLWGYVTTQGRWAVLPRLEEASDLSQGLAPAKVNGRWGYIDRHGLFLIPAQFDEARAFHEDRAAVKLAGAWGYIDLQGQWVVEPKFATAGNFSEGLAAVNNSGYIDTTGRLVIALDTFKQVHDFSEGLAAVQERQTNKFKPARWGYIDHQGRWVIAPRFEIARDFQGGMARVSKDKNNVQRGYIHKNGRLVWDPADWERTTRFKNVVKTFGVAVAALLPCYMFYALKRRDRQFYYLQTIS